MSRELQELDRHLAAASNIVRRLLSRPSLSATARNPAHFRPTGHLSDAGIAALYKLFDAGKSIEQAAAEMGISIRGAASRRQVWAEEKKK